MNRRELLGGIGVGAGALLTAAPVGLAADDSGIVDMSALSLSEAIHARTVSCVEVMRAYLTRIERLNPTFNAIVSLADADKLVHAADRADRMLARGEDQGWLHGFPVAVKDLANASGFVTSMGSPIFANQVATSDSVHVARMKQAGAIVIGKTNVPEFGLGSQSYNTVFGATGNPYDAALTAGGSSGGAAAALALRMVPVADGSDFMGSLRNPAAFCNVIGFRPSPGVVPIGGDFKEALACNGPMGRNVSDTAMLLSTIAGYHPASPASVPTDTTQFTKPLERSWRGARIGWLGDFDGYLPFDPGVLGTCRKAVDSFALLGCRVEDARLDFSMPELWQTWLVYRHWMTRARGLGFYQDEDLRGQLKPEFIWEVEQGAEISGDQVNTAVAARARFYASVQAAFGKYDALVWPTTQVFPFPHTLPWPREVGGRTMDTYHRWMETVIPGTLAGCPVINVPAGFRSSSPTSDMRAQGTELPLGLQVMTPRFTELKTLQLAYAYEQATRWNLDHPPPALMSL